MHNLSYGWTGNERRLGVGCQLAPLGICVGVRIHDLDASCRAMGCVHSSCAVRGSTLHVWIWATIVREFGGKAYVEPDH